ncbi:MAG: alanine racemase [Bacteroidales bacterium]|nr:alanine racemase [Bacteroidales bacterium]
MLHTSYIELSKSALNNNIQYMKSKLNPHTRYSMVVKANAYGHGVEDLIPMAEQCGVDHFSVFSAAEAVRVNKAKQGHCELMIMGFVDNDQLEWVIEEDISFFVFSMERLKAVEKTARKTSNPARIHIELETGMHRTGFTEDELDEVMEIMKGNRENIKLEGLCTHFAGAEDFSNFHRIKKQIANFNRLTTLFKNNGLVPRYHHTACSAGVLNFPESVMDLARVGISNYGFWPSDESKLINGEQHIGDNDPLKRVLSWKSKIMSVNRVAEGEYVSYGSSFMTNRDSLIATIPVGYGYGFSRNLSNLGHVLVNGKRVTVIGAVNMNMMVVDVTDVPHVKIGDEVVLIGSQANRTISVSSFSDMNNSMNYELLTRLPQHIPRYAVV